MVKKFLFQKNFRSKKIYGPDNFLIKKNFGSKNIKGQKMLGPKKCWCRCRWTARITCWCCSCCWGWWWCMTILKLLFPGFAKTYPSSCCFCFHMAFVCQKPICMKIHLVFTLASVITPIFSPSILIFSNTVLRSPSASLLEIVFPYGLTILAISSLLYSSIKALAVWYRTSIAIGTSFLISED